MTKTGFSSVGYPTDCPSSQYLLELLGRRATQETLGCRLQVLKGMEFDWIVGAAAIVVALSVQAQSSAEGFGMFPGSPIWLHYKEYIPYIIWGSVYNLGYIPAFCHIGLSGFVAGMLRDRQKQGIRSFGNIGGGSARRCVIHGSTADLLRAQFQHEHSSTMELGLRLVQGWPQWSHLSFRICRAALFAQKGHFRCMQGVLDSRGRHCCVVVGQLVDLLFTTFAVATAQDA